MPHKNEVLSCKSKKQYSTRIDALLAAADKGRSDVTGYRCNVCRFWHYTSKIKGR